LASPALKPDTGGYPSVALLAVKRDRRATAFLRRGHNQRRTLDRHGTTARHAANAAILAPLGISRIARSIFVAAA